MVTGRCAPPRSMDKHRKAVIAWCCAQVVMSANAFVMSFLAMPHNPTEHDVAARVGCTVKVIILVVQSYHLPVSLLVGSQANLFLVLMIAYINSWYPFHVATQLCHYFAHGAQILHTGIGLS